MAFFTLFIFFPTISIYSFFFFLIFANNVVLALSFLFLSLILFFLLLPHLNSWLVELTLNKNLYFIMINQSDIFNLLGEKISAKKLKNYEVCLIKSLKIPGFYFCKSWFSKGVVVCSDISQIKSILPESRFINVFRTFYSLSSNFLFSFLNKESSSVSRLSILKNVFIKLPLGFVAPPKNIWDKHSI